MSSSDQSREFRPGRDIGVAGARRAVATASSAIVVGLTAGFQNMVAYWKSGFAVVPSSSRSGAQPDKHVLRHGLQHVADLTDHGYSRLCAGRYFGMRHPGEIYGYICAGATVASGVGPVAMNCVSDLTGSCPVGLIVVGMLTCGLICVLFLKPCGFAAHRPGAGD